MEEILPGDETALDVNETVNMGMSFCKLGPIQKPSLRRVVLTRGLSTSVTAGTNQLLRLAPVKWGEGAAAALLGRILDCMLKFKDVFKCFSGWFIVYGNCFSASGL